MSTTCTVTAMITDPSQTNLLGNAYVKFRLRNFLGFVPQVSGTSVMCEDTIVAYPNPAGVISQVITCNTAISPVNTFYTVEFWNQGRLTSSANYFFNSSIDLSVAQEINPPPPPPYYGGSGSGSSSTSSPVGSNVAILPALQSGAGGLAGYTLVLRIPAGMIAAVGSKIKVGLSFYSITSVAINAATVGATLPNPVAGVGLFLQLLLDDGAGRLHLARRIVCERKPDLSLKRRRDPSRCRARSLRHGLPRSLAQRRLAIQL